MAGAVQAGALVVDMSVETAKVKANLAENVREVSGAAQKMAEDLKAIRKGFENALDPLKNLTVKVGSLESNLEKAKASSFSLAKGLILGAAAGMSIDAIKNKVMGVIDSMATLKTLSEKTGSSVENLSKIGFFSKQAGSDIDSAVAAISKMSKGMAGADKETKGAGLALSFLGIKAKDTAGNLKDPAAMLMEVAKKLNEYEDGAGKAAIAQTLFGKSGADMLPTLKLMGEQGDIVAKTTDAQATAARQYQRDLVKLDAQKGLLFKTIAVSLLPTLSDFTDAMIDATKNTNLTNDAVKGLAENDDIAEWADNAAMGVARLVDVIMIIPKMLKAVSGSFSAVGADLKVMGLQAITMNPFLLASEVAQGRSPKAELKAALEDRNKTLEDANSRWDKLWNEPANKMEQAMLGRIAGRKTGGENSLDAVSALLLGTAGGKKKANFNTSGEDGDDAAAALKFAKADLDARLNLAKTANAANAAIRKEGLAEVAELNRQGLASDTQLYVAKYNAALAAGNDVAAVKAAEIEILKNYNGKDAAEKRAANGKIAVLEKERVEALRAANAEAEGLRRQYIFDSDKPTRDAQAAAEVEITATYKQIAVLKEQYETYGLLPEAIAAINIAKLEKRAIDLEENNGSEAEIAINRRKLAALRELSDQQRKNNAQQYTKALADENRKFAAESIFNEKDRAAALLRIDATIWQQRVAMAGDGTEAQKRLQEEYAIWYRNQLAKPEIEANRKIWEAIDSTAYETFTAIFEKGRSTFDRLRDTLKSGLLALLYQMTIKKWIFNIGASVTGAGMAGAAGAGDLTNLGGAGAGGIGSTVGLINSAKNAFTIATQGFAGVATGIGGTITSLGTMFGSSAISAFGAGMGMTGAQAAAASAAYGSAGMAGTGTAITAGAYAGAAVTAAAGIAAGVLGGNLISGQYGSTKTVNLGTAAGTVAGAIFSMTPIGAAIGGALGGLIGGAGNRLFGMGDKRYGDTGITGTLTGTGFTGEEYAKWTQKGGYFRSNKADTDRKAVDATTSNAFVDTYAAIRKVSATLAETLGVDTSSLATRSQALNINLTGLKTEAERLEAVTKFFVGVGNDIAVELVPNIATFKVGTEELSATLERVSHNYAGVDMVLQLIGRTSQEAFGAVGVASIGARESLIKLAGGLDALSNGTAFFSENFLTEAERMGPVLSTVADTLAKLGMSGVKTTEDYKKVVLGLDLSSAAGQEMYIKLLALAPAFKAATDYTNQLAIATGDYAAVVKTAAEIASEHLDLQKQLNELTKSEAELLAIQRSSIADVNRALFDQVQAAKAVVSAKDALAKAYDRESTATAAALDKSKSWVATLNGLNASLALGSQSTLTPEQKYAEARAQFEKTLAAANAGDTAAQSGLSAAEQAFLAASQVVNASDARYTADYARVIAANEEASKWAAQQVDVQQASLDALKAQVSGLITINDSVLTVAQAISNLQAAMGMATGLGVKFNGSHASGLANVPFDGYAAELHQGEVVVDAQAASAMRRYFGGAPSHGGGNTDALVVEIKSLREEVKGLRADQAKQTGAAIQANQEANANAAKTVVSGVEKSANASAWDRKVEYAK